MKNNKKQLAIFLWMVLTTSVSFALVEQSAPFNIASLEAAPSIERERLVSDSEEERRRQQAVVDKCPLNLQINYPDGEKGCLTQLPISKKTSKKWDKSIGEVVKSAAYYAIVASESCNVFEIVTSNAGPNQAIPLLSRAADGLIRNCSADCKCSTAVMNGAILLSKSLAMSLGSTSVVALEHLKAPEKQATNKSSSSLSTLEVDRKKQQVLADKCVPNLQITYPDGEKGCLNQLPVSKKTSKKWDKPIGDVVNNSMHYAIVAGESCNSFEVFTASGLNPNGTEPFLMRQANGFISSCSINCNCSIVVMNGSVLLSKTVAMALGSPNVASLETSKVPEKQALTLNTLQKDWPTPQHISSNQALVTESIHAERDRLAADLAALRKKQQDLEEQLLASQALKQKEQMRVAQEVALQKEQERQAADQKVKDQLRIAQEVALQKEQERHAADQKIKEQLRIAEETSKANALELSKLKEELAGVKLRQQEAKPMNSSRKALVIGNDNYFGVPKLANARQDANAVGRTLSELGYKVMVRNDLNEKEMKATLRQFKNEIEGGDEVIFFYAGHGVQLGSTNYLLPIDIKSDSEDQVRDDAIQLQRLLDDMTEKKVKLTLAMIDACRDNPFPKSGRTIGGRGLAPTTAATGQMIIFSAGSGQQALDKLGPTDKSPNGLFTRMLLNEMKAPGVRVDNMIRNVRRKVVEAAKSVGHDQVPAIYDQVVGDFYLSN